MCWTLRPSHLENPCHGQRRTPPVFPVFDARHTAAYTVPVDAAVHTAASRPRSTRQNPGRSLTHARDPLRHRYGAPVIRKPDPARVALDKHIREFFRAQSVEVRRAPGERMSQRLPDFSVYVVGPGDRGGMWTHITAGGWRATQRAGHGREFVLSANANDDRHVEVLAMLAWFHAGPADQRLDLGHTVPLGEPWTPGSACDHILIDLPYLYGPELELCPFQGGHIRLLAAMPITPAERQFKIAKGLEERGDLLEEQSVDYSNPLRASVV